MSQEFEIKNIDPKPDSPFTVHVERNKGGQKSEEKDIDPQHTAKISLDDTTQKLVIDEKQGEKYCSIRVWQLKNSSEFQITKSGEKWTIALPADSPPTDPPTVNIDVGPDPFGS